MMKTPPGDKTMTRVPFYDMLANQKYRFMFQYVSVANDEKQDEIIENDYDEDDHSRMITDNSKPHDCSDSDESEEEILKQAIEKHGEGAPDG
jgi:hypothetical protein